MRLGYSSLRHWLRPQRVLASFPDSFLPAVRGNKPGHKAMRVPLKQSFLWHDTRIKQETWTAGCTESRCGDHCCCWWCSLGTRPSHAEEEESLVNLHTYKFEVRGISAGWIWLVDDCVITFLPTKARVRVITTEHGEFDWWTSDCYKNGSDHRSTRLDILHQISSSWKAVMKGIEVFGFTTRAVELLCYGIVYVHQRILAHGSHGGRRKSIVVIVSHLEALVLDVAEAFTAMDTGHANFVSQHTVLGCPV